MNISKKLMADVAMLYYKKNYTQQQIAEMFQLSRQTVSKLINDAINENIVEIIIHNPETDCLELQNNICKKYNIKDAIILPSTTDDEKYRTITTVKGATEYLLPILSKGNKKIGISWGRTIEELIDEFPKTETNGNIVFPLFGATDTDKTYFSSNELARNFSNKLSSKLKNAWFPYLPVSKEDAEFIKKTSCYQSMKELWKYIDIAIVGIGSKSIFDLFNETFGIKSHTNDVVGDIATHFFNLNGNLTSMYDYKLCASVENIKNAKQTVAVACGDNKTEAIIGALKTGLIDTLITDEYTAKKL